MSGSSQDAQKYHFHIKPGQMVAQAKMSSPAECDMAVRVAGDIKRISIGELIRVPVR